MSLVFYPVAYVVVVGESDGTFKGKRYFKCPENHGYMVRVDDVISILASKVAFIQNAYHNARLTLLAAELRQACLSSVGAIMCCHLGDAVADETRWLAWPLLNYSF